MRVRTLKAVTAYWNYEVRTFPPGEEFDGDLARHLATTSEEESVEILEADPEPEPEGEELEADGGDADAPDELDIDGTAQQVLAWVGDDPERAEEALAAEQAKDKPRSTLVKALEKTAESEEDAE